MATTRSFYSCCTKMKLKQFQLSCSALLCNLTCSQFWPGLSSFVYHSPLLLLPVLSIHCHHLTQRTRSSRSSRCSSRGKCPDAAFALTTVVWTAAVAPSVWAEPAGGAPGECSLSSPQAHLPLSLLVLFFFNSFPPSSLRLPKSRHSQRLSLSCSESLLRSTPRKPSSQSLHNSSVHSEASDASLLSSLLDESSIKEHTLVDSLWGKTFEFVLSVTSILSIFLLFGQLKVIYCESIS